MSEWLDAEEAHLPIPDKRYGWRDGVTNRTGLWLHLQWAGERERAQILEACDLPSGRRALLVVVNGRRPGIRKAWIFWDPSRMSLENRGSSPKASAEARPQRGDAVPADLEHWQACFNPSTVTRYQPHRGVEVRAGGDWHPGGLRRIYHGPDGRGLAWVDVHFYEPEWNARVVYWRWYCWDPEVIRPTGADLPERA
ncbi:hypothetical protein ACFY1U_28665 [Streptomyces sp. NPDC001351]|uniref:hypothetical protein n=1 Tax=Streptomyces sp. NPDC001351 TaxID=3364564 RepID=UPI00368CCD4D